MIQNPTTAQKNLIKAINETALNFGKFEIDPHPFLPHLNRFLEVYRVVIDLKLQNIYIYYKQVLEDADGNIIANTLPTPIWEILETSFSEVRDLKTGQKIEIAMIDELTKEPILNEDGSQKTEPLQMPTHSYMKYLENKGMTLSKIIGSYVSDFYEKNKTELNKLG